VNSNVIPQEQNLEDVCEIKFLLGKVTESSSGSFVKKEEYEIPYTGSLERIHSYRFAMNQPYWNFKNYQNTEERLDQTKNSVH
jgi:hypothetical protein